MFSGDFWHEVCGAGYAPPPSPGKFMSPMMSFIFSAPICCDFLTALLKAFSSATSRSFFFSWAFWIASSVIETFITSCSPLIVTVTPSVSASMWVFLSSPLMRRASFWIL